MKRGGLLGHHRQNLVVYRMSLGESVVPVEGDAEFHRFVDRQLTARDILVVFQVLAKQTLHAVSKHSAPPGSGRNVRPHLLNRTDNRNCRWWPPAGLPSASPLPSFFSGTRD